MIVLSTILILFFVDAFDTKNIFKTYKAIPVDDEIQLVDDRDEQLTVADSDMYELLGLVILDHNPLTRRNIDMPGNSTDIEDESEEDDYVGEVIEPTAYNKCNDKNCDFSEMKRARKAKKHIKYKKTKAPKKSKKKAEITTKPPKALRVREESEEETEVSEENANVLRAQCVSEAESKINKCIKACCMAVEEVCNRLACSARSQRELRKECRISCKKVFHPDCQ